MPSSDSETDPEICRPGFGSGFGNIPYFIPYLANIFTIGLATDLAQSW